MKPGYGWGIDEALKSIGRQILSDIGGKIGEKLEKGMKDKPFFFYGSINMEIIEKDEKTSKQITRRGYYNVNGEGKNFDSANFIEEITRETFNIVENSVIKPLSKKEIIGKNTIENSIEKKFFDVNLTKNKR